MDFRRDHDGGSFCGRGHHPAEKAAPMREFRVGGAPGRGGLPSEMLRLRASGDGTQEIGGKKYEGNSQKGLNHKMSCAMISTCVTYTLVYSCLRTADNRIGRCIEQQCQVVRI